MNSASPVIIFVAVLLGAFLTEKLIDADQAVVRALDQASRDKLGAFWNDFKDQWNAVNPANLITETDYDPADYKV